MNRFKREANMPLNFSALSEEQKSLVEMIYENEKNKESAKVISETVSLIKNDLDFVLYELDKLS
jgi:hypothetical protein